MDRAGANFERTVAMIEQRLQAKALPVQLPLGSESAYEGVIDLLEEMGVKGNIRAKDIMEIAPRKIRDRRHYRDFEHKVDDEMQRLFSSRGENHQVYLLHPPQKTCLKQ
jgi:translation elongation factor EF-G